MQPPIINVIQLFTKPVSINMNLIGWYLPAEDGTWLVQIQIHHCAQKDKCAAHPSSNKQGRWKKLQLRAGQVLGLPRIQAQKPATASASFENSIRRFHEWHEPDQRHQGTESSYLLPRTSPYTPQKTTNMDVNTTQVLTPRATNCNAFIFDLAPPCSYTMKLGTQHVFDCLICTNTQEMNIPI